MIECLIEIGEAELNDLLYSAGVMGWFIGLMMGMGIAIFFIYTNMVAGQRNFKMWLLQLPEEDRKEVYKNIDELNEVLKILAKSNVRYFKKMHNDVCRLKSFLSLKRMQG